MEAIADDIGAKLGEMERFMEVSTNFMQSVDLANGIYEEDGLKQLVLLPSKVLATSPLSVPSPPQCPPRTDS